MPVAIALSGGGSKGAFEVGAVRYLYDQGVRPDILCGVSVGAITAAKLAEGEGDDPMQGLRGLEDIWRRLMRNQDMYLEEGWLSDPRMNPTLRDFLLGRVADLSSVEPPEEWPSPGWGDLSRLYGLATRGWWLVDTGQELLQSLALVAEARSLYNLRPIEHRLRTDLNQAKIAAWAANGGRLRLGMVGLESGRLRWVAETGAVIEADGAEVTDLAPMCPIEQAAAQELEEEIRGLQEELKTAASTMKGDLGIRIKALQRQLVDRRKAVTDCIERSQGQPARADLADAVLASSSVPGVFPPVWIGGETYVDGGVREILPAREALRLGADVIYTISASPSHLPRAPKSFANARLFDIVGRALTEIMVNEVALGDELAAHRVFQISPALDPHPAGPNRLAIPGQLGRVGAEELFRRPTAGHTAPQVIPITPTLDIYTMTTIDPGLIQINRDYGYMRAADALTNTGPGTREWALSDEITSTRVNAWHFENLRDGRADPRRPDLAAPDPDPALEGTVSHLKQHLQVLLAERSSLNAGMPPDVTSWVGQAERHPDV